MPPCRVDSTSSSDYTKTLRQLRRRFPKIQADLDELYGRIAENYECGDRMPRQIPELAGQLWKFRAKNSSENRGASYGFRVIGRLRGDVMYLIFIYSKTDQDDITPEDAARRARKLEADLNAASEP